MSKWITDREPTADDAPMNYIIVWSDRHNVPFIIDYGDWHKRYPWMPIPNPEPYVAPAPKLHVASDAFKPGRWIVFYESVRVADNIPTCEAAERIAAIYKEVMPFETIYNEVTP